MGRWVMVMVARDWRFQRAAAGDGVSVGCCERGGFGGGFSSEGRMM